MTRATTLVIALGVAGISVWGQAPAAGQNVEWRHYGRDLAHTRYAPIDQISAGNFSKLEVAWRFKTDSLGPRPEFQFESTPLMVDGLVYSTAGTRRAVVALDAATGEQVWMHSENEGARGAAAPRQLSGRGLAYWTDGKDARILYVTPGYRLVALDAKTGIPASGFGARGIVDLKLDFDQQLDLVNAPVGLHATPMVARDVVIVGAAFETGANPRSKTNVKGYVRGFDVRTGKRLWIFHTIPRPGEFGNDTWQNDSWVYTGNVGVWAQISVDEELGIAYLPVELPTHDYYGGARPGANLFSESLVAVDLRTGQRKWHYQLVHHGMWDMDIPCAPILADVTIDGRPRKIVAQPTKQAFLYVFDRVTGEPIWPIEERPVPKGDVPGEWYSPTQPFPTKPPAYDRQGLSLNDLIDFTPDLRAEAEKIVSRYKIGPMFTPPVVSSMEGPIATLTMAAQGAATNWPGGSYDPETQMLYVASQSAVATLGLVPPPPGASDLPYHQGTVLTGARRTGGSGSNAGTGAAPPAPPAAAAPAPAAPRPAAPAPEGGGGGGALNVQGLLLIKPPYSRISAIDLTKGEIRWQVPHGETPDNIRNHPALKGLNIPRTGRPGNNVGTLVTRTLVIAGEGNYGPTPSGQRGAMLRAYDKATGQEVGAVYLPAPQSGSPMSYLLNGRQYIVIAIGGAGYSGELVALRLPS
jgi:quinoprotein glucose dehydrogenase